MAVDVAAEVAALQRLTVPALRSKYAELFGDETRSNHKTWLIKRIVWRLQAHLEKPLSERGPQRARDLAADSQLRLSPPRPAAGKAGPGSDAITSLPTKVDERVPPPGSIIARRYQGKVLQVKVRRDGFEFDGAVYTSLSAVAAAICGSHCNGFLFFRLGKYGETR